VLQEGNGTRLARIGSRQSWPQIAQRTAEGLSLVRMNEPAWRRVALSQGKTQMLPPFSSSLCFGPGGGTLASLLNEVELQG
jgi:hypothetical protein